MNNIRIDMAMPWDWRSTPQGAIKFSVKVLTRGNWMVIARKGSKEVGEVLVFKRAQDRDRYLVMLMATFGPAVHDERKRMEARIKRVRVREKIK